ncbi:MAG TPA: hypothetical protein VHV31_10975 [Nitrolancea sp.]|jgi:hypothetical protein|nr:hypothetical protein [Nitrolancea sp.]
MRVDHTDDGIKIMVPCGLCHREFQFGPHRYVGRWVRSWGISICDMCESANHDGIVPQQHPDLVRRLTDEGVPLQRLPGGFFRIPHRGH